MLLFISALIEGDAQKIRFQYISCYCLSRTNLMVWKMVYDFNTSHVTVYQKQLYKNRNSTDISIHLMLLFILVRVSTLLGTKLFQYISCYCLSLFYFIQFIFYFLFQYISCYCLSNHIVRDIRTISKFQYISCYCLSKQHL